MSQRTSWPVARHPKALFAIRRRGTCLYLPARRGRGHTNDEPELYYEKPPRFFSSYHAAQCALAWWLKGAIVRKRGYDSINFFEKGGGYWEDDEVRPRHRKREDMEIVTFTLTEREDDYAKIDSAAGRGGAGAPEPVGDGGGSAEHSDLHGADR